MFGLVFHMSATMPERDRIPGRLPGATERVVNRIGSIAALAQPHCASFMPLADPQGGTGQAFEAETGIR